MRRLATAIVLAALPKTRAFVIVPLPSPVSSVHSTSIAGRAAAELALGFDGFSRAFPNEDYPNSQQTSAAFDFCTSCGARVGDWNFCANCGAPLALLQTETYAPPPENAPSPYDLYRTQQPYGSPNKYSRKRYYDTEPYEQPALFRHRPLVRHPVDAYGRGGTIIAPGLGARSLLGDLFDTPWLSGFSSLTSAYVAPASQHMPAC